MFSFRQTLPIYLINKKMAKKDGILTRAKHFYSKSLCHCDQSNSVVECTVLQKNQLPKNDNTIISSSKNIDNGGADIQDLMRLISMRKGGSGGARVDVDSEGNLVWRKPVAAVGLSYGGGVGRIGRIDEDKPCCFSEADVHKLWNSRSVNSNSIHRRGLVINY
ncbi:hypothetical protein ABFS83_02G045100 [Erythranthe nasuta]